MKKVNWAEYTAEEIAAALLSAPFILEPWHEVSWWRGGSWFRDLFPDGNPCVFVTKDGNAMTVDNIHIGSFGSVDEAKRAADEWAVKNGYRLLEEDMF